VGKHAYQPRVTVPQAKRHLALVHTLTTHTHTRNCHTHCLRLPSRTWGSKTPSATSRRRCRCSWRATLFRFSEPWSARSSLHDALLSLRTRRSGHSPKPRRRTITRSPSTPLKRGWLAIVALVQAALHSASWAGFPPEPQSRTGGWAGRAGGRLRYRWCSPHVMPIRRRGNHKVFLFVHDSLKKVFLNFSKARKKKLPAARPHFFSQLYTSARAHTCARDT
jgi:hypothetical protein